MIFHEALKESTVTHHIHIPLSLSLNIYIYIYREREREREMVDFGEADKIIKIRGKDG